jgi:hypothetical protein
VLLKTDESDDYAETVASMPKTRKHIKHVPRVKATVPTELPALQTIKHTLNLDRLLDILNEKEIFCGCVD